MNEHLRRDIPWMEVPFLRRRFPDWPEEKMRKAEIAYLQFLDLQLQIFEEAELEERLKGTQEMTVTRDEEAGFPQDEKFDSPQGSVPSQGTLW